jgi:ATP-dependent helicase/nuclease subunit A
MTPLDWLLPTIAAANDGSVDSSSHPASSDRGLFDVRVHDIEEMAGWRVTRPGERDDHAAKVACARCDPLPDDEPLAPDDTEVEGVLSRLNAVYPWLASASVRATMAASEFRGAYDSYPSPETGPMVPANNRSRVFVLQDSTPGADAAAQRGVITHRVLQHLDFTAARDAPGVVLDLKRMVDGGLLTSEDHALIDVDSLGWFVSTPLAGAIRGLVPAYRREFRFIATEALDYFDRSVVAPPDDRVLVRGIVDGILAHADHLEIVDFKTDAVRSEDLPERTERYRPQLSLYARAMSRIWRRPVRACWLVFLVPRRLVNLSSRGNHP